MLLDKFRKVTYVSYESCPYIFKFSTVVLTINVKMTALKLQAVIKFLK
jgi:hypothetical protein